MSYSDPLIPQAFTVALLQLNALPPERLRQLQQIGSSIATDKAQTEILDYLNHDPQLKQQFDQVYDELEKQSHAQERTKSLTYGAGTESWQQIVILLLRADDLLDAARKVLKQSRAQFSKLSADTQILLASLQSAIDKKEAQTKAVLTVLDDRLLTPQDLAFVIEKPLEETQAIVQFLWKAGYVDRPNSNFWSALFSKRDRHSKPTIDENTYLTLTAKGYFFLHPLITPSQSGVKV